MWRGSESSPVPPLVGNPDPSYEACARSDYWNNFEKSKRKIVFFQSNKVTACKVRDKKGGGKIFDGVQST